MVCAADDVNHSELHKPQGETETQSPKAQHLLVAQVALLLLPASQQTQQGLPSCL